MNMFVQSALSGAQTKLNEARTTNGAKSFKSTLCANLDFFNKNGNLNYSQTSLINDFSLALAEDEELAVRSLLEMRDIRGGKGVRDNSRILLKELVKQRPALILRSNLLEKFIELGRYDDLFHLVECFNPAITHKIVKLFAKELHKEDCNNLLLKWLPINSKKDSDKRFLHLLRKYMKIDAKTLRKRVVSIRKEFIPEYKFCTKQWSLVDYSKLPSQCFRKNKRSFQRNDSERFDNFIQAVIKGDDPKVKVNAGAIWPHEVIGPVQHNNFASVITEAVQAQWNNLPNFMPEGLNILPLIDVSGSMTAPSYSNFTCMNVAIALGLYTAERNKGSFKDLLMTFTSTPSFISLAGCNHLVQKYDQVARAPWGMSTDLNQAFQLILKHAVDNKVPQEDMPHYLLIASDMMFNSAISNGQNSTVFNRMKQLYAKHGYTRPTVIFWNLSSASHGQGISNIPVTYDEKGSVLISGYSPSVLKAVFENKLDTYTPLNVMMSTLMNERYNIERIAA